MLFALTLRCQKARLLRRIRNGVYQVAQRNAGLHGSGKRD
jgi:hypothetical protein